ncbi:MAG TPA: GxxExxY protein [Acidobacteriaceae bacterium]|nr:GxxExxY protein [Acidobacteriaceae bacterium]
MDIGSAQIRGKHDDLTQRVIGVFYDVYNELGPGFLESVYREAMRIALAQAGLRAECEVAIPVFFRGNNIGIFRADLIVNGMVLVELKACEAIIREHVSQTLNYLKATKIEVALLMNFGAVPRFRRLVMDNESKGNQSESVPVGVIGVKPLSKAEVVR